MQWRTKVQEYCERKHFKERTGVDNPMRGPMIETDVWKIWNEGMILGYIEYWWGCGLTRADAKEKVIKEFKLDEDEAEEEMKEFTRSRRKDYDFLERTRDRMKKPVTEAEERRVWEEGRKERREARGEIRGYIESGQELDQSRADTKERVIIRFKLDEDEAEEKMQEFWIEK